MIAGAGRGRNLLKVQVLKMEMDFDDAGGFDARAQDVLLGRHVILGAEALQIIQEASVTDHGGDGSEKHTH